MEREGGDQCQKALPDPWGKKVAQGRLGDMKGATRTVLCLFLPAPHLTPIPGWTYGLGGTSIHGTHKLTDKGY